MKIIIEGFEKKDFPVIKEDKREDFETKIKNNIIKKLDLREKDEVILRLIYLKRAGIEHTIIEEEYEHKPI